MRWNNKFGMFIHWGLYAILERNEQEMARFPANGYERLAGQFNPVCYDPEQWVLLAKQAGMQYICFTAKHHDGFCMWDTKETDYNIMHTPYGKDVLKMLAEACQKHGMKLSIYYSNPDWHHPHGYNPHSTHQWQGKQGDFEIYKAYIRAQITELLTNYGPVYTLFWDIPPGLTDESMNAYVRSLQPEILINDRGFDPGDFSTPERETKKNQGSGRYTSMTEACNAIDSQSWGYRADTDFYTYRHMLMSIDKVMARGGSYLLNVGPKADGTLDPAHAERIRRIGAWYNRMEGTLEGHEEDTFDYAPHKSGECIAVKKNGKTYFHFYEGTRSTGVAFANYPGTPKTVRLMNTGEALDFAVEVLPGYFNKQTGEADHKYLHIYHIPADDLAQEPIVIEVEW